MGAIISAKQHERIVGFIDSAQAEGARLICGGGPPADQALARGLYIEPTVFADVTSDMRLAREEVFGPVHGILRWSDAPPMIEIVNELESGLTCLIWTRDLERATHSHLVVDASDVWLTDNPRPHIRAHFMETQ